jgi:medium-chain acyl-[acyl-carrier-protein] hydrolase
MSMIEAKPWIIRTRDRPRLRLFCFPYAGGGVAPFRQWSERLPPEIEVCPVHLAGRESRLKEPPAVQLAPLAQELARALAPVMDDVPFALFGHSMGALICFELMRYLRRMLYPMPIHLFVSAYRAPQLPDIHAPLHRLPDARLLATLRDLGGTPQAVLQNAELMSLMLPVLRADLMLCETYTYTKERPFACPITAFGGAQDTMVSEAELQAWRQQTSATFRCHMLPGDHFFLQSEQSALLRLLSLRLIMSIAEL